MAHLALQHVAEELQDLLGVVDDEDALAIGHGRRTDATSVPRMLAHPASAEPRTIGDAMRIYTRKGDDGTTGLLYGGDRVSKADLRTDAYGTTDEAVSALGLARASIGAITDRTEARLDPLIVRLQRELFVVGAELATHADRRERLTPGTTLVTAEMVSALEAEIDALEATQEMPVEFVLPGESMTGAALDLARSVVRRAERRDRRTVRGRRAARLARAGLPEPPGRPALRDGPRGGWGLPARPEPRVESPQPTTRPPAGCTAAVRLWRGAWTRRPTR